MRKNFLSICGAAALAAACVIAGSLPASAADPPASVVSDAPPLFSLAAMNEATNAAKAGESALVKAATIRAADIERRRVVVQHVTYLRAPCTCGTTMRHRHTPYGSPAMRVGWRY